MVFTLVVGTILVAVAVDAMFAKRVAEARQPRTVKVGKPATFLAVDGPRTR